MGINILIALIFCVALGFDLYGDAHRITKIKNVTKPLLVSSIMLFYIMNTGGINKFVVMALFFGFVGDVMLIERGNKFEYLGMMAFFTGHIFYISAFYNSFGGFDKVQSWIFYVLIAYAIYGIIMMVIIWNKLKELKDGKFLLGAMMVYVLALFTMSFTSLCYMSVGFSALSFIGSLFFIVSDSFLGYQIAMNRVINNSISDVNAGEKKPDVLEVVVIVTYVIAQVLIMLGLMKA